MIRVSRGSQIVGDRSADQIRRGIENGSMLATDHYYDEDASEWLPLSEFLTKLAQPKQVKPAGRACYCGSGLGFAVCHGDGSQY